MLKKIQLSQKVILTGKNIQIKINTIRQERSKIIDICKIKQKNLTKYNTYIKDWIIRFKVKYLLSTEIEIPLISTINVETKEIINSTINDSILFYVSNNSNDNKSVYEDYNKLIETQMNDIISFCFSYLDSLIENKISEIVDEDT